MHSFLEGFQPNELGYEDENFSSFSDYQKVSFLENEEGYPHFKHDVLQSSTNESPNIYSPFKMIKQSIASPDEMMHSEIPDEEKKRIKESKVISQNLAKVFQQKQESKTLISASKKSGKSASCNCRKSNCLKLYCDCLAQGRFCNDGCGCKECKNNNVETVSELHLSNSRNIDTFVNSSSLKKRNFDETKGCTCKKSRCEKKYCECFARGEFCGEECSCANCTNTGPRQSENKRKLQKLNSGQESVKNPEVSPLKEEETLLYKKIEDLKEKCLSIKKNKGSVDMIFNNMNQNAKEEGF